MSATRRLYRSERGAIFVQIAVAMLALMALNVFVVDYGLMWTARGQAQNAADAGALAGATARAFDEFGGPPPSNGVTERSARTLAAANLVWRQSPAIDVAYDCPPGDPGRCVRVNVFRDAAHANPLDTFFGPILGITSQHVRATATARVDAASAVDCLRPIAFPDDWVENTGNLEFNRYDATGAPLSPHNVYTAPSATGAGGWTVFGDVGERIIYALDQPMMTAPITRPLIVAVTLPNSMGYYHHFKHCSGDRIHIGQTLPAEQAPPGWTDAGFTYLMNGDSGATWNEAQHRIETSCAPGCGPISPRLIAVALFDPDKFQKGRSTGDWTQPSVNCPTNNPCLTVTNIVGFFIHGAFAGYGPHGHFLPYPGLPGPAQPGETTLVAESSWLVTTHLIR